MKTEKHQRSINLIADFQDGYAKGWCFAVGECFRDQLDIKYTNRVEKVIIDGVVQYETVLDKNGKHKRKVKTRTVQRWTQGQLYCFDEGHIIYNTPQAYLPWKEALKHIKIACEIVRATPNVYGKEKIINGNVTFKLSRPNLERDNIETINQYNLTQNEFVDFLKYGKSRVVNLDEL